MKKQSLFKKNIQKIKEETIYEEGFPNAIKIDLIKQDIQTPPDQIPQDHQVNDLKIDSKKKVKVSSQEYNNIDQENKNFMKSLKKEEILKYQEEIKGMFEPQILQKFKKESFFDLSEEQQNEQEKMKEQKIDEFLQSNTQNNTIDIPFELLTYETQIQMICFDTKGKLLEQESKDNKLKDLALYEPGTEYFNLLILENMLYYDQQFQVNLAGLNLLQNFLDRIKELGNDLVYEDKLKIFRVHVLEYLEKKMLICFRLCDFLRSKNVSIIAGSLNCLLRYLQVLIGDDLNFFLETGERFKQDQKLQRLLSLFLDILIFDNLKQIEKYYLNLDMQRIQEFYDLSTKIAIYVLFLDTDQSLRKQFLSYDMMVIYYFLCYKIIINKSSNPEDIQIVQNLIQKQSITIIEQNEDAVIKQFDTDEVDRFSDALCRQVDANFPFFMVRILRQIIPKTRLLQYKSNKDLKQELSFFQVDLDNLFEILISIKLQNMQKYLNSERKKINFLFDFLSIYFKDFLEYFDFQIMPFNSYKIMMILKILKQQVEVILDQNSTTQAIHQHVYRSNPMGYQMGLGHIIGDLKQIKKINFIILDAFKIFTHKKEPDFFMSLDEIQLDIYFKTLFSLSNKVELANLVNLNPEIVDKLINAYQYNSYGNMVFTKIIFFFMCNSFSIKLRKRIIANLIIQYSYSFYEALKNGPYGSNESYTFKEKDFKEYSDDILSVLSEEGHIENSFLVDFLNQFK